PWRICQVATGERAQRWPRSRPRTLAASTAATPSAKTTRKPLTPADCDPPRTSSTRMRRAPTTRATISTPTPATSAASAAGRDEGPPGGGVGRGSGDATERSREGTRTQRTRRPAASHPCDEDLTIHAAETFSSPLVLCFTRCEPGSSINHPRLEPWSGQTHAGLPRDESSPRDQAPLCQGDDDHGLAPPRSLPRRRPRALLPDRQHGACAPADRGGEGRVPPLRRGRHVPEVGHRVRPGRRRLGRPVRGRAPRAQAAHRPRAPRRLSPTPRRVRRPRAVTLWVAARRRSRTRPT